MKKNIVMLFSVCFAVHLVRAATPFNKTDFYSLPAPKLLEPQDNEKAGINLTVNIKTPFRTVCLKGSEEYRKISYDRKHDLYFAEYSRLYDSYDWKASATENGNYLMTGSGEKREGIILDRELKPVRIIRYNKSPRKSISANLLLIEFAKYHIPDRIVNINDTWEYSVSLLDNVDYRKDDELSGKEENGYYGADVKAKFKLTGYALYDNRRCAVIESDVNITFITRYVNVEGYKTGGTLINELTMKSLLYIDYDRKRFVLCRTKIVNRARGNFIENWGPTLKEAVEKIREQYKDSINGDDSYFRNLTLKYNY